MSFLSWYAGPNGGNGDGGSAVAPTFGAAGAHSAGVVSPVAYPSGISAGDLLEIHVVTTGSDGTTAYSASGWIVGPTFGGIFVLWKQATGSESGSVTVTRTGTAPTRDGAVMVRYSGVSFAAGAPHEGITNAADADTSSPGPSASMTSAPITTTANGRLLVNIFRQAVDGPWTPGSGWANRYYISRVGVGPDYVGYMDTKDAVGFGLQAAETGTPGGSLAVTNLSYALIGL